MKNKILLIVSIIIISISNLYSQFISGTVYEITTDNKKSPLPGANVYWIGTTKGTSTDDKGKFKLDKINIKDSRIIVSYLSYSNDTILVKKDDIRLEIVLSSSNKQLNEITIKENNSSYISKINPRHTQVITTYELSKAACCNLAESFETNASVDVSFSDAITGAKQIQLLGLSGIYSQIQTENVPSIRGLASTYGLNYIPGSWMESIQVSKGTSSVINGYESITGQINVEYKKPEKAERLFLNLYANSNQRYEANIVSGYRFNDKFSTAFMIHGDDFRNKINKINTSKIYAGTNNEQTLSENFIDQPLVNTINIISRWEYCDSAKYESRLLFKYLEENRNGGTIDYDKKTFVFDTAKINNKSLPYGFGLNTKRAEAFWKNGFMFKDKPWQSVGVILSAVNHDQSGFFGVNNYTGKEQSLYANIIFQSIIKNSNHKYSTGISYLLDDYKEGYDQTQFTYIYQTLPSNITPTMHDITTLSSYQKKLYDLNRQESVPGAFFEYTYNYLAIFSVITGIRADYHNIYGAFVTPRTNLRYQINESTILRASAGLGYRTANILSENLSLLASQRILVVEEKLNQEKAANYGINLTKDFKLFTRKSDISIDIYRTDFINQVIVDLDRNPEIAYFYNLKGKSYSNSYQIQFTSEPIKSLSILMAFRINDVKITSNGVLQDKLLVNRYKGLITISYATKFDKWKFDLTSQFNGSARMAPQDLMPEIVRRNYSKTPQYVIINTQVTKKYKNIDVYLGVENLTNFTQKDPITESFIPYHTHFDTTMVWGPIVGRVIYGGLRYFIK